MTAVIAAEGRTLDRVSTLGARCRTTSFRATRIAVFTRRGRRRRLGVVAKEHTLVEALVDDAARRGAERALLFLSPVAAMTSEMVSMPFLRPISLSL